MNVPRVLFSKIKDAVLGTKYELSLAFISSRKMRELNRAYRKKDAATDILSFPLSKESGEIFLCMSEVKKKAVLFCMTEREYLGYVFIHGLIHLEGFDHGRTMTRLERKFSKAFGFPSP
jgi:probable rRNA maturation factor